MSTEYIKALINWAIDCYQTFPKKSDYESDIEEDQSIDDVDTASINNNTIDSVEATSADTSQEGY